MTMVEIWIVRVPMDQAAMLMDVDMRLRRRSWRMAVLVMLIVHVDMLVLHRLMGVLVLMSFSQM